ncbi:MAG: hypothetical protein QXF28_00035 [Nitrososphaerota archaeon]
MASALVSVGWNGFGVGSEFWVTITLVVALLAALLVMMTGRDIAYGLVAIWALTGIAINQGANQSIVTVTIINIIILILRLRHL